MTLEDEIEIALGFGEMTCKEIAEIVERSPASVSMVLRKMYLEKKVTREMKPGGVPGCPGYTYSLSEEGIKNV